MSDASEPLKALLLMDIALLWILKDKGIVTTEEIQERLRQTKQMFSARYGEGAGTTLIEAAMEFFAKKTAAPEAEIVPFPDQTIPSRNS